MEENGGFDFSRHYPPGNIWEMNGGTKELEDGEGGASELLPRVYDELRRLAAHRLAGERHEHTLQPTALVHEAWLRMGAGSDRTWSNRGQFFAAAAEAMRRILVDRARRRLAAKRGGGAERTEFLEDAIPAPAEDGMLVAVSEALERFAEIEPKKAELVKLRYFAGFTFEQAAEALEISVPTANRWWAFSRAWLLAEMKEQAAGDPLAEA